MHGQQPELCPSCQKPGRDPARPIASLQEPGARAGVGHTWLTFLDFKTTKSFTYPPGCIMGVSELLFKGN